MTEPHAISISTADSTADERYRAFIQNSTEGIWRFDTEEPLSTSLSEDEQIDAFYRVAYLAEANDAFARMYGYERGEELVGARLGDLLVRDDPANDAYLRAFVRSGYRLADIESVERDRDGNLRHFSNTLTGINEDGILVRVWGTQRDITAQREAEKERGRLLAQLGAVLQTATDGIIVSDPAGNTLMWNPAALALHGYDSQEAALRHLSAFPDTFAIYPPTDQIDKTTQTVRVEPLPVEEWPLARVMRGETFTDRELLVRRRDTGKEWWASYSGAPARGADGTILLLVLTVRDVSERVRTRNALRASEARYRRLLDTAMEGILFLDTQAVIARVNQRFATMLGYGSPEELVGQSIFGFFFAEDQERARHKWAARLAGENDEYELRLRRRDGSECWVLGHISVERDEISGAVLGTFSMVTEITERRNAMEALRAKSDEVNAVLESIGDAFFALDGAWRFSYVNAEAERLLSRERRELVGRNVWEEFPAAVGSEFETQYRRAARERVTVAFQAYYPPPLDSWYDVRAYPSPTGAGLSVYFRNINEERRREEEREQLLAEQERLLEYQERLVAQLEAANARQMKSLEESEDRFRLLVENVQDYAILILDPFGNIATWNAGAERLKGYKAEEIVGQHFSRFYTPEDIVRRHPWNELEIATREGRYEEEGWRVRKDGTRFWANVVITALHDDEGHLRGFGKVTRDFTERRQREQERASAQALEQQRRFLKDILRSVTEGRLRLCDSPSELPAPLSPDPVGGGGDDPIPLSAQALKAVRARVNEVCAACGVPKDSAHDLVTAASECAMNAVMHAGGGIARIYGDAQTGRVQVWVVDEGRGIDLSTIPRATLEAGFSTGGVGIGHGFSLMISTCQGVYLLTGPSGTTVVLERSREAPEPSWLGAFGTRD